MEQRDEVNVFPTVMPLSIFLIAPRAHIGETASGKARATRILARDSAGKIEGAGPCDSRKVTYNSRFET